MHFSIIPIRSLLHVQQFEKKNHASQIEHFHGGGFHGGGFHGGGFHGNYGRGYGGGHPFHGGPYPYQLHPRPLYSSWPYGTSGPYGDYTSYPFTPCSCSEYETPVQCAQRRNGYDCL